MYDCRPTPTARAAFLRYELLHCLWITTVVILLGTLLDVRSRLIGFTRAAFLRAGDHRVHPYRV